MLPVLRRLSLTGARTATPYHAGIANRALSMRAAAVNTDVLSDVPIDGSAAKSAKPAKASASTEAATVDTALFRTQNQISLINEGNRVYAPLATFNDTPFSDVIKRVFAREGYTQPTMIQAQSWPIALEKRDMISVAKTGSGKTCAFLLPAIHSLLQAQGHVGKPQARSRGRRGQTKVLVLAPTRELAVQIDVEAQKFTRAVGLSSVAIFGGSSKHKQISDIRRGADIIVATPGRCNDLLESGELDLSEVSYLVLDEADRMLDMGFMPQIESIIECTLPTRQNLFFTATWPKEVQQFADTYLTNPVNIRVGDTSGKLTANLAISQNVKIVQPRDKYDELLDLLTYLNKDEQKNPRALTKTLIFVSRKHECDDLAEDLRAQGFSTDTLHGDKTQVMRDRAMTRFRGAQLQILVATDVAGRGLDVKDIQHVINYDFPAGSNGVEDYVHRIGRTGRAGMTGKAFTFFTKQDEDRAEELIGVLERSEQYVPPLLQEMANNLKSRRQEKRGGAGRSAGRAGGRGGGSRPNDKYGSGGSGGGRGGSFGGGGGGDRYGGRSPSFDRSGGSRESFGKPPRQFGNDRGGGGRGGSFPDRDRYGRQSRNSKLDEFND